MITYRAIITEVRTFHLEWDEFDDEEEIDRIQYALETAQSYPDTDWILEDRSIDLEII